MRESSRRDNNVDMDMKYKFNAGEYSKMLGITPSALRKRRLSGKLEGQFIKKGSEYFYSSQETHRPNKDKFTVNVSRSKHRRRNVPDSCTNYHKARNGHQLKALNDLRQLTRINKSLNESQIAEITDDIIEVAKQRRRERIAQQEQEAQRNLTKTNYGGFINCNNRGIKDVQTSWRPLYPQQKDEYDLAMEEATEGKKGIY